MNLLDAHARLRLNINPMNHDGFHGWRGFIHHPSFTASASAQGRRERGENLLGDHQETTRALMMGTGHVYGGVFPSAPGDSHRAGQPAKAGMKLDFLKPAGTPVVTEQKSEFSGREDTTGDRGKPYPRTAWSVGTNPAAQLTFSLSLVSKGFRRLFYLPGSLPPFHQDFTASFRDLNCLGTDERDAT